MTRLVPTNAVTRRARGRERPASRLPNTKDPASNETVLSTVQGPFGGVAESWFVCSVFMVASVSQPWLVAMALVFRCAERFRCPRASGFPKKASWLPQ